MIINISSKLPKLNLIRDVSKHIKRGHCWVFSDCFDSPFPLQSGLAFLTHRGKILAFGVVQADTQLKFRVICLLEDSNIRKVESQIEQQWENALQIRQSFPNEHTDCFRLINGEGDGFPGLTIDIYRDTAVIKHDHAVMEKIWNRTLIAEHLIKKFSFLKCVYFKRRNDEEVKGENLIGELAEETSFCENGIQFRSQIKDAAKTGFFLDQRDNRQIVRLHSKGRSVLNLFSYTGGFSIYAAMGGAKEVTSVDVARAAILAVNNNFEANKCKVKHEDIAIDAFAFVEQKIQEKKTYGMVITDPPSFAPNQKAKEKAEEAYIKIYSDSLRLVERNGYFVASSCSSHITYEHFLDINREAFSRAKRRGTLIYLGGQPFDHPYPLNMEELRYLKFALFRAD